MMKDGQKSLTERIARLELVVFATEEMWWNEVKA